MTDTGHRRYRIANPPGPPASPGDTRRISLAIVAASWLYAGTIGATWAIVRWSGAESWPVHLLLYGPRWALALPMVPLIPLAAWRRSRPAAAALVASAAGFLALSGFVFPGWSRGEGDGQARPALRVLTCNVQGGDLDVGALANLIREARPDLIMLQECRLPDPGAALGLVGWDVRAEGEFCLASRSPLVGFSALRRPDKAYRTVAVRAEVSCSGRMIPVVSVHLMTPRKGLEAIIRSPVGGVGAFRESSRVQALESGLLRRWVGDAPGSILMAGDFNLTAEHPLYRRDWTGFGDAFEGSSWGLGETMFTRRIGLRIDHVLGGPDWRAVRCRVGPDVGSAHRPVLADLSWVGH